MHPIERRIRSVPDSDVYQSIRVAYPGKTDQETIAELARMIVFVAVCWNDVVESGEDADRLFDRHIFRECDELAEFFPWPT